MSDRPTNDDRAAWKAYWEAQGMPWRTEPEIDGERQQYLSERRAVKPDIERGIYPFRDERGSIKLDRADVEWLLATHEGGRGPVRWKVEREKDVGTRREGLDLRGADLRGSLLMKLPLARMHGGLLIDELPNVNTNQRDAAAVLLQTSVLEAADLHDAVLSKAQLQGAVITFADMDEASLDEAQMQDCVLGATTLRGAMLGGANLEGADLRTAIFDRSSFLTEANLNQAHLDQVFFDSTNLAVIDWGMVRILGDEIVAKRRKSDDGTLKHETVRLREYQAAVRAHRQLAIALRSQGLNADADRFSYKGQVLERQVLRRKGRYGTYLGSMFLDLISGYGYKPLRSFLTYILVVLGFAAAFFVLAPITGVQFEPLGALVFSVTSFHGRGFSPGEAVSLTNLVTVLAAGEAIIGLLIEITFIATFTQRFFAR